MSVNRSLYFFAAALQFTIRHARLCLLFLVSLLYNKCHKCLVLAHRHLQAPVHIGNGRALDLGDLRHQLVSFSNVPCR